MFRQKLVQIPSIVFFVPSVKLKNLRRDLGKVILSQECEMTKLLAGSIIREMLSYGLPEDKIWPVNDTPAAIAGKFPRYPSHPSQWIWDFHSYLEHGCPQDRLGDQ